MPFAVCQEFGRNVNDLCLNIFGESNGDGAGFDGICQNTHGTESSREQLFGALHAIKETRERLEGVVDTHAGVVGKLELLQHGICHASSESVRRKKQNWKAVGGGNSSTSKHVGGTGAYGCCVSESRTTTSHA